MDRKYGEAFAKCLVRVGNTMKEMPCPPAEFAACGDGFYFRNKPFLPFEHIGAWMISFFTGEALLAYHRTREQRYLDWVKSFLCYYGSKLHDTSMDTMHDLGFLYTLYATGYYKETGDTVFRGLAVKAADELAKRMNLAYGMIRAWGRCDELEHHSAGLAIIDCMMNLPLLFFAWEETGNPFYRQIAELHADNTLKYFIREDGSVCHGYQFMAAGGAARGEVNHCGYQTGSFWARGLTWAIYGYAVAYRYTGREPYLRAAITLGERFLEETKRTEEDLVPPWDFRLPESAARTKDSSAAAIAACAFHELSRYQGGEVLKEAGEKIMDSLMSEEYQNTEPESCGILIHSNGKEHCTSFGDYFYMEALLRYLDGFQGYW